MDRALSVLMVVLMVMTLSGVAAAGEDTERLVCAFENQSELGYWMPAGSRTLSPLNKTQGRNSLEWTILPDEENLLYAERLRTRGAGSGKYMDFSAADELVLDVHNPLNRLYTITVRMSDKTSGVDDPAKSYLQKVLLRPGDNTVKVHLGTMIASGGARINPAELIMVELGGGNPGARVRLFLDNLRLVIYGDTPGEAEKKGIFRFDFGAAGSIRWKGFRRVSKGDKFDAGRGWGWSKAPKDCTGGGPPDGLAGDSAFCEDAAFKVKLPEGKYKVWMLRAPAPRQEASWSVSAGGERLAGDDVDAENFFTGDRLFKYLSIDCDHRTDIYGEYFGRSHPGTVAGTVAGGAEVELSLKNVSLSALVLWPEADAAGLESYLKALAVSRREDFKAAHYYEIPLPDAGAAPVQTPIEQARGYILFVRDFSKPFYPNSNPEPGERGNKISLVTTLGAPVSVLIGMLPTSQARDVAIVPGEMTFGSEVLHKDAVKLFRVRFLPEVTSPGVYRLGGAYLHPIPSEKSGIKLKLNRTEFLWLTIDPGDAKPGKYTGKITLTSKSTFSIDVKVVVQPFKLPELATRSVGLFYRSPGASDVNYRFGAFEEMTGKAAKYLKVELGDMKSRGFNCVELPQVKIKSLSKDRMSVELDLSELDEFADAAMAVGIGSQAENILPVWHIPDELRRRRAGKPQHFTPCYRNVLEKLRDWAEDRRLPVVFGIFRSDLSGRLTPKQRFADGRRALDLAKRVPGVRTLARIRSDDSVVGDIDLLLPMADVLMTEPYMTCQRVCKSPRKRELQSLWFSGSATSRFVFGFQSWRMGAMGRWTIEYQNWTTPYNPFGGGGGLVHPGKGPVPTVAYERIMAGVTDLRHIALLEQKINEARAKGGSEGIADGAENALADLKGQMPPYVAAAPGASDYLRDLPSRADAWRAKIAGQITVLMRSMGQIEDEVVTPPKSNGGAVQQDAPKPKDAWGRFQEWLPEGIDAEHALIVGGLVGLLVLVLVVILLRRWRERSLED